ncbi:hypothetical protein M011DRAFT_464243 [Sporormia fimetaria CBS 119925]|uniref:Arrestin-like N-terminal domain-containing protein n=1 Tax=Sporormia fimetaria CBS 119925 TaxID=1340428 RepID=A0A6A6VPJ1_9PLEO|nr:hypothetical protein M011DRAFT_464243 [Sporormia fimetaria CBS 119925]
MTLYQPTQPKTQNNPLIGTVWCKSQAILDWPQLQHRPSASQEPCASDTFPKPCHSHSPTPPALTQAHVLGNGTVYSPLAPFCPCEKILTCHTRPPGDNDYFASPASVRSQTPVPASVVYTCATRVLCLLAYQLTALYALQSLLMPPSSCRSVDSDIQSLGNQIGSKMRTLSSQCKPVITIDLNDSHGRGKFISSYSTMDNIEGTVFVTSASTTSFDNMEIAFVGSAHSFVDKVTPTPTISGRTEASHRFLTLKQPISDADLPPLRKFEAGKKYAFPFSFTIPAQLLPKACPHSVSNENVRQSHLMLPPSTGDPDVSGFGSTLLDDMAPEMARVTYMIRVRIVRNQGANQSVLADKSLKVRVKPAFQELPPLPVDIDDIEYRLRQEKVLKKGLFKGRLGTLTAQAVQPRPLTIPGARSTNNSPIATVARVLLRFDPSAESLEPPRLGSIVTKMRVSTYYASAPRHNFPTRSSLGFDLAQGLYQQTICLSTLCIASAPWQQHTAAANPSPDITRRDSAYSSSSSATGILPPSKDYRKDSFYTAEIIVPVTLPNNKNFLPTFHSCLISRIYTLCLSVSAHTAAIGAPTLHLKVPIQICAEGSASGNENARARSAEEVEARAANDLFLPRSTVAVAPSRAPDLPPEYALGAAGRYSARVTAVA